MQSGAYQMGVETWPYNCLDGLVVFPVLARVQGLGHTRWRRCTSCPSTSCSTPVWSKPVPPGAEEKRSASSLCCLCIKPALVTSSTDWIHFPGQLRHTSWRRCTSCAPHPARPRPGRARPGSRVLQGYHSAGAVELRQLVRPSWPWKYHQIRQRDSTEQSRMNIDQLYSYLSKQIDGF